MKAIHSIQYVNTKGVQKFAVAGSTIDDLRSEDIEELLAMKAIVEDEAEAPKKQPKAKKAEAPVVPVQPVTAVTAQSDDTQPGGQGDDTLTGDQGDDTQTGGDGDDGKGGDLV
jgi:Ca2+-binding RTX toxin-like protein